MKFTVNKVLINLILISITVGLFWYVVQPQNLMGEKTQTKSSPSKKIEILFTDKNYSLDYSKFDKQMVDNISLFNSKEKWVGSGFYDSETYFESPSSLYLAGGERNKVTDMRDVSLNLAKILSFDLMMNFRSEPDDLESGELAFIDAEGKTSKYVLPRQDKGWKAITMPKEQFVAEDNFNWANVVKVRFDFLPRPYAKAVVNLGSLRGQPGSIVYNDWNVNDQRMLLLDKRNNNVSLLARNLTSSVATIKKITQAANFTFQSSYTPLNTAYSGLFFRGNYQNGQGYYLMVNGINGNQWQITKTGKEGVKVLATGEISNFQFKKEEKYYLKVVAKGKNIKAFLSTDNINYTLLADVYDDEFLSGGVGVAVGAGAVALYNNFEFNK